LRSEPDRRIGAHAGRFFYYSIVDHSSLQRNAIQSALALILVTTQIAVPFVYSSTPNSESTTRPDLPGKSSAMA